MLNLAHELWCTGFVRVPVPKPKRICYWCRRELTKSVGGRQRMSDYTRDHVIPRCLGGRRTVPSCYRCNQVRGIEAALLVGNFSAAQGLAKSMGVPLDNHDVLVFYSMERAR